MNKANKASKALNRVSNDCKLYLLDLTREFNNKAYTQAISFNFKIKAGSINAILKDNDKIYNKDEFKNLLYSKAETIALKFNCKVRLVKAAILSLQAIDYITI